MYRRRIHTLTSIALAAFAVALPVAEARSMLDDLLFHPRANFRQNPDSVAGVAKRQVTFKAPDKHQIKGWYFDRADSDKIVLVSEGNGGNMAYLTSLADLLIQNNCSVLLYDYEGYGESEGSPSLTRVVNDGLAAYDYMKENLAGNKKIILLGVSLGTGVSCQILKERKADAVILSSPFTSLLKMVRIHGGFFKYVPSGILPRQHLDNVTVLKKPHPPLLILHGTKDELIPFSEAEALFAAAAPPKTFIKLENAGHNDTFRLTRAKYLQAITEFFASLK